MQHCTDVNVLAGAGALRLSYVVADQVSPGAVYAEQAGEVQRVGPVRISVVSYVVSSGKKKIGANALRSD